MRRSIIAGVDGSPEATKAAAVAASLARRLRRRLVLAHFMEDPPVFPYGDLRLREAQRRRLIQRGTELLIAVASQIGEETACTRVAFCGIVHGGLADALDSLAREEDGDLLVGSGVRRPILRALLGSPSAPTARPGSCPVLVVPSAAAQTFADPRPCPEHRWSELDTAALP